MDELGRYFFLAGAVPFLVLGTAHAILTPLRIVDSKGLSPLDASLSIAMEKTPLALTRRTNMWLAWVGFNLSHSLGALMLGAACLIVAACFRGFAFDPWVLLVLALVSSLYLLIAVTYWFRIPIVGVALATACLAGAWLIYAF